MTDKAIQLTFPTARTTDPKTSHIAGAKVLVRAGSQRWKVLQAYLQGAAIDDEIGQITGLASLPNCCYWKRCSELRQAGYIEPTGDTRLSRANQQQMVCRITKAGRDILEQI